MSWALFAVACLRKRFTIVQQPRADPLVSPIRDYTVKVGSVVHTIMRRVNYTGSQLQNEDQVGSA